MSQKVWKCMAKTDHYHGLWRWPCPCSRANFIRCTTMARKHSILFARQMCHLWGRQMCAIHFVENNTIDPALHQSYRFSSNVSSISTGAQTRSSQWLILTFFYLLIYWDTFPNYFSITILFVPPSKFDTLSIIYKIQWKAELCHSCVVTVC